MVDQKIGDDQQITSSGIGFGLLGLDRVLVEAACSDNRNRFRNCSRIAGHTFANGMRSKVCLSRAIYKIGEPQLRTPTTLPSNDQYTSATVNT